MRRTVLGPGAMRCVVLDMAQVFVDCPLCSVPDDAVPGILGWDVVPEIPVLVDFLTASAVLLVVAVGIPTTVVTP